MGQSAADIMAALANRWPNVNPDAIITATSQAIIGAASVDPRYLRGWVIDGYRMILKKALEIADLTTALKALKLIDDFSRKT